MGNILLRVAVAEAVAVAMMMMMMMGEVGSLIWGQSRGWGHCVQRGTGGMMLGALLHGVVVAAAVADVIAIVAE